MKNLFMRIFPFCLCLVLAACSNGNINTSIKTEERDAVSQKVSSDITPTNTVSQKVSNDNTPIDAVSQKVINDINSIGDVTLDDEQKIAKTLELYKTLTDNQKEQVSNYIDLLNAQDKIEQLKEEQRLAKAAEKEEYLKIEREYYDYVDNAISTLKYSLKHPSSLVLNEIIVQKTYNEDENSTIIGISIDYTANNDFGIPVTNYYRWSPLTGKGIKLSYESFSLRQNSCSGNSPTYIYKWGENFYSRTETLGERQDFIFKLDMEDYNNR